MINYLLIVGSATSDQYEVVRRRLLGQRIKTITRRISGEEWEAIEHIAVGVELAYERAKGAVKTLLMSTYVPLAPESSLYVPMAKFLDTDLYNIAHEAVGRLLSNPTATVAAIVIDSELWLGTATELWQPALPTCPWHILHPNGWLESA